MKKVILPPSGRLIGRVMIGKIPPQVTESQIENILDGVALPNKELEERCRHWVWRALYVLQANSVIAHFDIEKLRIWLLGYANQCLAKPSSDNIYDYTKIV